MHKLRYSLCILSFYPRFVILYRLLYKSMKKFPRFASKWINIISLVVVAIAVLAASYFFLQYQKSQKLLQNPTAKAQAETQELLEQVGKIYALPNGTPTVATVSDKSKLSTQAFFASAQNGDKVLIYTDAKKAILYRPSTGQVIEVGPITIQDQKASDSATLDKPVTVSVLNGTTRTGLTKSAGDRIADLAGFEVTERSNAETSDYSKTIVVDVNGENKVAAESLAKSLGASVGTLPEGEEKSSSSIIVILGEDYQE